MPTLIGSSWLFSADFPEFSTAVAFKHLRPQDQSIFVLLCTKAGGVAFNPDRPAEQRLITQTMKVFDRVIDQLSAGHRDDIMLLLTVLSLL